MKQKITFLFLLAALFSSTAKANESEPNDTKEQANTLALNGSNTGEINPATTDVDWWKVTTDGDGNLSLTLTVSNSFYCWFALYDNNGTTLLGADNTAGTKSYNCNGLATGTYYIKIYPYYSGQMPAYTISNTLTKPAEANDAEPNDIKSQAKVLPLNGSITGHVNYYYNNLRDSADWYKVTTNADGRLRLRLTSGNSEYVWAYLYDNDGTTLLAANNTASTVDINADGLAAGTYYIRINSYFDYLNNNYTNNHFEPYTIADSLFTPSMANDAEPNDIKSQAKVLSLNGSVTGHVNYYFNHLRDSADWYKVTTNADGRLRLRLTSGNGEYLWAYLYDNDGTTLLAANNTASTVDINADGLAAGTYYIRINSYFDYLNNNYTGNHFEPYTIADSLFTPDQANDAEPNDSVLIAKTLAINSSTTGHVNYYYNHKRDAADWYKITLPEDGMLNLTLSSANGKYAWVYLYDNDGTTLINQLYTSTSATLKTDGLAAGTYYVRINSYYDYGNNNYNGDNFEPYTLADTLVTYTYAGDTEPNDYAAQAQTIPANGSATGHVNFYYNNSRNNSDWWKINYTSGSGNLTLNINEEALLINGSSHYYWVDVYSDTNSSAIYHNYFSPNATINLTSLTQGYYYLKIYSYYSYGYIAYSINPVFTQTKAKIKVTNYDTTGSCDPVNAISFKLSKSSPPYTVQLYRFGKKYGAAKLVAGTKTTFHNLPSGAYFATVYGDGATGSARGYSDTVSIEPLVTGLNTINITSSTARLTWTKVNCAAYYIVQYKTNGASTWKERKTTDNKSFMNLKKLKPDTKYNWTVAAVDSDNNIICMGQYAAYISFKTEAGALVADNDLNEDDAGIQKNGLALLSVFPNPANSYFTIHFNSSLQQTVSASLIDMNGKVAWNSGAINSSLLNGKQVQVSSLVSGLYYLKITDSNGEVVGNTKISITR